MNIINSIRKELSDIVECFKELYNLGEGKSISKALQSAYVMSLLEIEPLWTWRLRREQERTRKLRYVPVARTQEGFRVDLRNVTDLEYFIAWRDTSFVPQQTKQSKPKGLRGDYFKTYLNKEN